MTAGGDLTLTNHGVFDISGAEIKTTVDAISPLIAVSGAGLYFVPTANGQQINLIEVDSS